MTVFGRPLRSDFLLQADGIFLNNGSFGSVPAPVRSAQQGWRDTVETQPDIFFRETIYTATRAAAARVARLCGTVGEALVFTPNVTESVAVVLAAMDFKAGDEILLLDVAYAAVRRAVDVTCRRTGAVVRTIPTGLQTRHGPLRLPAVGTRDVLGAVVQAHDDDVRAPPRRADGGVQPGLVPPRHARRRRAGALPGGGRP